MKQGELISIVHPSCAMRQHVIDSGTKILAASGTPLGVAHYGDWGTRVGNG